MKFLIAIEPATDTTACGVVVPDLPGCFSAGDTLEEAFDNAREAIDAHCEFLAEDGQDVPLPAPMATHQSNPDYAGWVWAMVDVAVAWEGADEGERAEELAAMSAGLWTSAENLANFKAVA